ncbi:cytochrome P450, partial [Tissierella creatinini]
LFTAGTDTTSSTLEWAMTELLRNPDILSKVRLELEQTIGKGNPIEESDITRLPYLQAVVKETLRLHPAVPLLLPRKALADVEIAGFIVPKGAQVFVNAWAIGRDELTWENPLSFMPERFLGSNLDFKGRNFELIPFGSG